VRQTYSFRFRSDSLHSLESHSAFKNFENQTSVRCVMRMILGVSMVAVVAVGGQGGL